MGKSLHSSLTIISRSRSYFFHAALILIGSPLCAQFFSFPQEFHASLLTERKLAARDSSIHTGLKPYSLFFSPKYAHVPDSQRIFRFIKDDPALDLIFYSHVVNVKPHDEDVQLRIDPILNLEYGADLATTNNERLYTNTRGFIGSARVGQHVYFETMFAENQAEFPFWLRTYANVSGVSPGQGRWKRFKTSGFDYAFAAGIVSVKLSKHLVVQAGHGKHKIGHGYRSLLLSDNAFNYPFVKFSQQWFGGQLQYHSIYAALTNLVPATAVITRNAERLWQKKPAAFQYLSLNPSRWLSIGMFQGMIWQAGNTRNNHVITPGYLNPVIFGQAASYGLNDRNNVMIGGDLKIKLPGDIALYGQAMLDGTGKDRQSANGFQAGIIDFNVFGIRNLYFQAEYNSAGSKSYSTTEVQTDQSWSHYGQPLAFTTGTGEELIFITDYRMGRLFLGGRYHYQEPTRSPAGSQPAVNLVHARAGFVVNPAYNLSVSAGILYRNQNFSNFISSFNESNYLYLALKTSLYNTYHDF